MTQATVPQVAFAALALLCVTAQAAEPSSPSPQGLVAHYTFSEGSGNTARDSISSVTSELHGVTWKNSVRGPAPAFDGKSAHIDAGPCARLRLTNRLSISIWIHPTGQPAGEAIVVGEAPSRWAITHYKSRVYFYISAGSNYCRAPVSSFRWTHVAATFDGTTMRLFVDGRLHSTRALPPKTRIKVGSRFRIGGGTRKGTYFNGLIDDIQIYNRPLSNADVSALSAQHSLDAEALAVSPRERDAGTQFFREQTDAVALRKDGRLLRIANRAVGIEFIEGVKGIYLSRLFGVAADQDFLHAGTAQSREGLWTLVLRRDNGRDKADVMVGSCDGARVSHSVERNGREVTLRLRWDGLSVAYEQNALDVEVTATVKAGDPLSRWRIRVANRSRTYGLWNVFFPVLELAPIGRDVAANCFAYGRSRGAVVHDPFHGSMTRAFGIGTNSGCYWPGTLDMQLQALYGATGHGLYLATHDGGGYKKIYFFTPQVERRALECKVGHFPANMGYPAEDYEMSYDFCAGPFAGDWYDACQIYRQWAIRQQWCQRGTLQARTDIPRWYKECPITFSTLTQEGDSRVVESRDRMVAFLRFIGAELPICWYTWKKHFPDKTDYNKVGSRWKVPDARPYPCGNIHDGNYPIMPALPTFSAACSRIANAGGHVKAYVCSRIYDPGLNENAPLAREAKPHTVRDVRGVVKLAEANKVSWGMCYHTPWWQQRMKETVAELVKREHVGGIYFDTFYGGYVQCFDTSHGHSHGGGADPYLGARKLSDIVRGAMKQADPQAVMSGESPSETAIDLLDGFLYRDTVWPDMAPMFATVYGDYIPRFGIILAPKSDGFYIQCATLFCEGAQMGRLRLNADVDWLSDPAYAGKMAFLRKLALYWQAKPSVQYLAYGRLLRPLSFAEPNPMPTVSYEESRYRYYKGGKITATALQSGVFAAPDGSIGVFIVNITPVPMSFSFSLDAMRYPLPKVPPYRIERIDHNGACQVSKLAAGRPIPWRDEIRGHDVAFLQVAPVK